VYKGSMESMKFDRNEYLTLLWKMLSIKLKRGGVTPHKEIVSTKKKLKEMSRSISSSVKGVQK